MFKCELEMKMSTCLVLICLSLNYHPIAFERKKNNGGYTKIINSLKIVVVHGGKLP